MNSENYLDELKSDFESLDLAVNSLKMSFDKCKIIGLKTIYNFEEQESFDSFTSKFARTSDIYTQKILKTIFYLLRETFIERQTLQKNWK